LDGAEKLLDMGLIEEGGNDNELDVTKQPVDFVNPNQIC
jgi:hypothetical protein